jgi:putative transposase
VQTRIVHHIRSSMRYVDHRDREKVAAALRPIYTAANADDALVEPERFDDHRGAQHSTIASAWRENREHITPFLSPPGEPRRAVYTTNTIEAPHRQIRKAIKTPGSLPDEHAATKLAYPASERAEGKRRANRARTAARPALKIHSGDRSPG